MSVFCFCVAYMDIDYRNQSVTCKQLTKSLGSKRPAIEFINSCALFRKFDTSSYTFYGNKSYVVASWNKVSQRMKLHFSIL